MSELEPRVRSVAMAVAASLSDLTLGNALFYLDYYNMAQKNGQTPTEASISGDLAR